MRCATLSGSAPRRPRPPGDGSAPGRWPKTRPTRATRLDWRVYPWVSSFFIKGYLMQVKTNKVVSVVVHPWHGPRHRVCGVYLPAFRREDRLADKESMTMAGQPQATHEMALPPHLRGHELLDTPALNKDTAFTPEE